ncbi:hypothetical protein OsJ_29571 [Oryza sativa Japonica Group]|uniref:Uncharacterized protein n=1 Tax=Oryza sativa subsp. japonica TaxID=39947 RepID=Q67V71_ORYSJ|nr:hypothetical protein OsJ_29571 [Oryza sativa Japonica Group]BAD37948.1 hypothetical protein [Oryza sativa Japonica Group]BAD38240.1 hypothetical protein [Oryza sativa Japonica Group]
MAGRGQCKNQIGAKLLRLGNHHVAAARHDDLLSPDAGHEGTRRSRRRTAKSPPDVIEPGSETRQEFQELIADSVAETGVSDFFRFVSALDLSSRRCAATRNLSRFYDFSTVSLIGGWAAYSQIFRLPRFNPDNFVFHQSVAGGINWAV